MGEFLQFVWELFCSGIQSSCSSKKCRTFTCQCIFCSQSVKKGVYNRRKGFSNGNVNNILHFQLILVAKFWRECIDYLHWALFAVHRTYAFFLPNKDNASHFEFVGCTVSFWLQPSVADKASSKLGIIKEGSTNFCQRQEGRFFKVRWTC
jgi:hypothetical protein